MRLRPGLALLWRDVTSVQVGTDPRWASVIADLTPAATRALHAAGPGAPLAAVADRLRAGGVGPAEHEAVLAVLTGARHLTAARPGRGPDATAWGLVSADGSDPIAARAGAAVEIRGLGRLGAQLAHHLAVAGVGTVVPVDPRRVDPDDLGVAGVTAGDVGRRRAAVLCRTLNDIRPSVRTRPDRAPDLVVTVEHGAADPVTARALLAEPVPHLAVVVREASVLVGPLVVPGAGPCLRCLDLHRADADPGWPAVGAQLCARGQRGAPEETLLAAVGAATAAGGVLAHVDGRAGLAGRYLQISLPDALPRTVPVAAHPDCGCTEPPAP